MSAPNTPASPATGSCGCGDSAGAASALTPAVAELVAIGAAIAANCEPCLRYHVRLGEQLGLSKADIAAAVKLAAQVKATPHQNILSLAGRRVGTTPAEKSSGCPCG